MRRLRAVLLRVASLFRRDSWERDLDAELQSNLALHIEDNVRAGMSREEARREAVLRFGSLGAAKDAYRSRKVMPSMLDLGQDLRQGCRSLWRARAFSFAVIATMALCIGANTTVLSALYGIVLKPLPVKDPERLVQVFNLRQNRSPNNPHSESSWFQYEELTARSDLFESGALVTPANKLLTQGQVTRRVTGQRATGGFFELLGAEPVLGRLFRQQDIDEGRSQLMVLSESSWEADFARDPAVVGQQVRLEAEVPYTIVGVAPRSLEAFGSKARFTIPYIPSAREHNPSRNRYNAHSHDLWLRLKTGVTHEHALQEFRALERRWFEQVADADGRRLFQAYEGRFRLDLPHPLEGSLYVLQAGALFIFLAGCFNVMILVLSRVGQRRQELATRQALGASAFALRRLVILEGTALMVVAVPAALALAWAGTAMMNRYLSVVSRHTMPIELDTTLLIGASAASAAVVILMNLVPLETLRRAGLLKGPGSAQRTASRSGSSMRLGTVMVVGQFAIAFAMLVGAGLLLNSVRHVMAVDPGFEAKRVVEGRLDFETIKTSYGPRSEAAGLKRRIVDAMREVPGVESVGLTMFRMFAQDMRSGAKSFALSGSKPAQGSLIHFVSPGFFATMGIPILAGRECNAADTEHAAVVDRLFVQRELGGEAEVGLVVPDDQGPYGHGYRIIGVAGRANLRGLEQRDGQPFMYRCDPVDHGTWEYSILLRTSRPADQVVQEMRETLQRVDPRLALSYSGSLEDALDEMLLGRRGVTLLIACFAVLALVLALIGVYAILVNDVVQRRREIGIRFALGARPRQVYALVLRSGLLNACVGLALGLCGAIALGHLLAGFLFDVVALDPATYAAAIGLFLLSAGVACVVPARRAVRVDPVEMLRAE